MNSGLAARPQGLIPDARPSQGRRLDLDNIRNIAVLLLIVFHAARLFDSESWHIKNATNHGLADVVVCVLNHWQMPILFLLAGMAAAIAISAKGLKAFLRERFLRLFIPLIAGIFLWVFP
jgi:glucans biosynthesis protein C